jgi:tetratricopeptide (TPR) repeat protein
VLKSDVGGGSRAARKSDEPKHQAHPDRKSRERKHQSGKGLSQGRIIAIFGGLLVVGVVIIGITRNQTKTVQSGSASQSAVSPTLVQDIEQLRKRVQTDSTDSGAILRLANLLHDGKFMDQAVVYYKKYLALNEKDADARVDLGICYFESGDKDRAIAEMKKALTYAPNHQLAHFNLGIVNLGSGNLEAATEWFKKCIAINPQTETARRAEELIKQHSGSSTLKLN